MMVIKELVVGSVFLHLMLLVLVHHGQATNDEGGTQFSHQVDQATLMANDNAIMLLGKVSVEDDNCIGWMSEKFWDTVKWYFTNARLVLVLGIDDDDDGGRSEIDSATSNFVNFLHTVPMETVVLRHRLKEGLKRVPYSRRIGIIIVSKSLENLQVYYSNTPVDSIQSTNSNFLFVLLSPAEQMTAQKVLLHLWREHSILSLMLAMPCLGEYSQMDFSKVFGFIDPFEQHGDSWGVLKWMSVDILYDEPNENYALWQGSGNFRGYPIKCEQFIKFPTVIKAKEIPTAYARSYIQREANPPRGYGGMDALVMATVAKTLNFTILLNTYDKIDFGYKSPNGTFTGSFGNILYKVSDVSFNNRFIFQYETNQIDFLQTIAQDKFCFMAPKAEIIPKWLAIFQCFRMDVWIVIFSGNILWGILRFLISRWQKFWVYDNRESLTRMIIETWNMMMTSPSIMLPRRSPERIFLGVCILANVIITGTFQGTLVTSLSSPRSFKDINTLEELDASGMYIETPSDQLIEIFGENGSPLLESLKKKLRQNHEMSMNRSLNRNVVTIGRMGDSPIIIEMMYTNPDGSPKIHVVKQCPRTQHMAYIVRKGWSFAPLFNKVLGRLKEAGE
ncbi:uncharacterized protein DMENIID0001_022640 [Sergentomyia squamirostris]